MPSELRRREVAESRQAWRQGATMGRLDMHTLQGFVRLARMGTGFRAIARMLRISPNTEREYRKALDAAGLLVGAPNDLPEPATLLAVLEKESSVERWATE